MSEQSPKMTLRNCLSYWFPKLKYAGLPVPETRIIAAPKDGILGVIDGETPKNWHRFIGDIASGISEIGGAPCFLRSGQTSGKHEWARTCYLPDADPETISQHVVAIVEFGELVSFIGLPTDIWVVRKLIPTTPLFTAFRGMPIVREFRVFVEDGKIACFHPYWPSKSVDGHTDDQNWRAKLREASCLAGDYETIFDLAERAGAALPGAWSIDVLQGSDGAWWVTDCADAGSSFHWPGCDNESRWARREFVD
jgi:hypothetical protein